MFVQSRLMRSVVLAKKLMLGLWIKWAYNPLSPQLGCARAGGLPWQQYVYIKVGLFDINLQKSGFMIINQQLFLHRQLHHLGRPVVFHRLI